MTRVWLVLALLAPLSAIAVDEALQAPSARPPEESGTAEEDGPGPLPGGLIVLGLVSIVAGAVGVGRLQAAEDPPA